MAYIWQSTHGDNLEFKVTKDDNGIDITVKVVEWSKETKNKVARMTKMDIHLNQEEALDLIEQLTAALITKPRAANPAPTMPNLSEFFNYKRHPYQPEPDYDKHALD